MNSKTNLGLFGFVLIAGAFYAGWLVTRQQASTAASSTQTENASKTMAQVAQPTVPAAKTGAVETPPPPKSETFIMPPEGVTAKLSPLELKPLLQNNPLAVAYAQSLSPDSNLGYFVINITKKWTADDPPGALAWAQGLPDDLQKISIKLIFTLYGTRDALAALTLAQSLPAGSTARAVALDGMANVAELLRMKNASNPAEADALRTAIDQSRSK